MATIFVFEGTECESMTVRLKHVQRHLATEPVLEANIPKQSVTLKNDDALRRECRHQAVDEGNMESNVFQIHMALYT
jgi:hypothetical protein